MCKTGEIKIDPQCGCERPDHRSRASRLHLKNCAQGVETAGRPQLTWYRQQAHPPDVIVRSQQWVWFDANLTLDNYTRRPLSGKEYPFNDAARQPRSSARATTWAAPS
ncbi:MAG: hypothetical protein M0C28_34325 [Candidatus Moduliflexus flocculans]|nr:hypothetical protein [Candidatus Moduliflexus flocculans]